MIFAFPGQGSQFVGMGKDLYNEFLVAKQVFNEIDNILNKKLSDLIFNGPIEELNMTENSQPAIVAVSIAILRVMEYIFGKSFFNFNVQYVLGHSVGEYAALYASGALTLISTIKLLKIRSKSMHEASLRYKGGMVALLGAEINEVENILKLAKINEICEIATDNGGGQVVVSGTIKALEMLPSLFKNSNVKKIIKLKNSGPFHSSLMKIANEKFSKFLNQVTIVQPLIPFISNVTAKEENDPKKIKYLLSEQIIKRVRWREIILYIKKKGINRFFEIGPNKVLSNLVKRIDKSIKVKNISNINDINKMFSDSFQYKKV